MDEDNQKSEMQEFAEKLLALLDETDLNSRHIFSLFGAVLARRMGRAQGDSNLISFMMSFSKTFEKNFIDDDCISESCDVEDD